MSRRDQGGARAAGDAGLNDGTAFPLVILGLGMLGVWELGSFGWRRLAIDVVWAVAAGLAIGGLLGAAVGRFVLYLTGGEAGYLCNRRDPSDTVFTAAELATPPRRSAHEVRR